ncbi:neprilysin-1 [Drosophila hydei]|uniref:Neprilysin-1 n=1 Tax=Drosophila hydei TaxID=7224 RepID=A0A6J2SUF5_DROHY|nr:neprilysin-1 [Drosophila hydei]
MRAVSASVSSWAISWLPLLLLLLSVLSFVYAGVFESLSINTPLTHEIMQQAKSAGMRSYINGSVKPCDDFYGYACGNFVRINPATHETVSTDFFEALNAGYQRRLRGLFRQPKLSTDSPTETRVKYFYESCLNTSAMNHLNQRSHVLGILKEFGGLPALEGSAWNESNFEPIEMMARLLNRFGKETLLSVRVAPGLANSQMNRLFIGQRDDLDSSKAVALHQSSQLLLKQNLQHLLGLSEQRAAETAAEIAKVNLELAHGIIEPQEEQPPSQMYRLRLLADMSESYGPKLNVTRLVQLWLNHDYQLPVYEYVESYMWQVKKILTQTPKRVLANYMLSTLISDYEIEPAASLEKQHVLCAETTTLMFADFVDHMVYRSLEKQNPDIPGSLRQLWQELKAAFDDLLHAPNTKWLSERTLSEAQAKLKAMTFHILGSETHNFEDYYGSLVISNADYFGNVQRLLELRAQHLREDLQRPPNPYFYDDFSTSPFYVAELNRVVIPASFMQHRYFFDEVYPMALKYGTVGFSMAHEMAHGFDDLSRTFDSHGNLRDWWERNATEAFEERKQCLVEQFSGYRYNGAKLPKLQLQSENIADNAGVRIAHAAYLNWLRQSTLDGETLPRMSHTPQQLFFLALGQIWCSDLLPEWRHTIAISDVHAPDEVRLYAMMANFDAFAKAYECRPGAHMNPLRKCVIY